MRTNQRRFRNKIAAEFKCSKATVSPDAHREQVDQVRVGVNVGRGVLDERELQKDGVQLLGLAQIDARLLFVGPVRQRHVHGYEVLEVHAQDGESEALALREALAVLAVVPTRRHQFNETVKYLQPSSCSASEFCCH